MSFWLDNDDLHKSQQNSSQAIRASLGGSQLQFECEHCGSKESYEDPVTGNIVCSECFVQSQTQTQESSALEYDEVMNMAARSRRGGVVQQRRNAGLTGKNSRSSNYKKKQPLEELNSAETFPDVNEFIAGFQRVLKSCILKLANIIASRTEPETVVAGVASNQIEETVRTIWRTYLETWAAAAEEYGALHPEIRFSLRDQFLDHGSLSLLVLSNLSYQVHKTIQQEIINKSNCKKEDPQTLEDTSLNPKSTSRHVLRGSSFHGKEEEITNKRLKVSHPSSNTDIKSMLHAYEAAGLPITPKEAALYLKPNMTTAASLLWISVSRMGVTSSHFCQWISNGSLPLLNAYGQLLTKKQQKRFRHFANSFQIDQPPSPALLESTATLLALVGRIKSPNAMSLSHDPVADHHSEDGEEFTEKEKNMSTFSFCSRAGIPLAAAHLIADLGLGQCVLDRTLELLGAVNKSPPGNEKGRLDAESTAKSSIPSSAIAPERIIPDLPHLLAVIFSACLQIPGWTQWNYERALCNKSDSYKNTNINLRKMVPWNEGQFRLVGNGSMLEGYLNFLENSILDDSTLIRAGFLDELSKTTATISNSNADTDPPAVVKPCVLLSTSKITQKKPSNPSASPGETNPAETIKLSKQEQRWERNFQRLLEFKEECRTTEAKKVRDGEEWVWDGNPRVKDKTKDGFSIGRWAKYQSIARLEGRLKPDHEQRLTETGLIFKVPRNYWETHWEKHLYLSDPGTRSHKKLKTDAASIEEDPRQVLLVEFLAHAARVEVHKILAALNDLRGDPNVTGIKLNSKRFGDHLLSIRAVRYLSRTRSHR